MRRDGLSFASGSEAPRPFSDVLSERPVLDGYTEPQQGIERAIDNAPMFEPARPLYANRGYANLKRWP
jgi:hypothetical protein